MLMSKQLPLLKLVKSKYPKNIFKNVKLLACQHILDTTHCLLDTMIEMGLKKENAFLLGKCYSTSPITFQKFRKNGFNVDENSFAYDSHEEFDETYGTCIDQFLKNNLPSNQDDKIILLDDGGGMLLKFIQLYSNKYKNVSGVEQTSSGFNRLKNEKISFPIMNVARSHGKLGYETPYIIESIIESMDKFLQRNLHLTPKKVLILGDGIIGKFLCKNHQIFIKF